jgi:hypothetical protein
MDIRCPIDFLSMFYVKKSKCKKFSLTIIFDWSLASQLHLVGVLLLTYHHLKLLYYQKINKLKVFNLVLWEIVLV